ncbi:MAG TPA: hypothetical protein VL966_02300 [Alphaproteobacteria bacterium]|jgi:uncharacterized phage-associated protein|nr:hypothetical protein [Alphaproteobacteria bacterium]
MPQLLATPAVPVSLDVALWFLDKARAADSHLPAQKIQNLLYLACAEYERAHDGRPLMPAAFVANDIAVVEPNVYRLFEEGRPSARTEPVSPAVELHLNAIWERFGHVPVQHLNSVVRRFMAGDIEPAATPAAPAKAASRAPEVAAKPQALKTQHGRQVTVSAWRPPQAPKQTPKSPPRS